MEGMVQSLIETLGETNSGNPDLLSRVLDLYFLSEGRRSASDTEAFGVVLERLAFSPGDNEKTRAELAGKLALCDHAPCRLMRRLAFDTIFVARPVLQYSSSLSENDLVTLAKKLGQDHLLAMAHRLRLPPAITDILVARGQTLVHVAVTQNSSAEFSAESISQLLDYAEKDDELKFVLGLRSELSPNLFNRFMSFVKDQIFIDENAGAPTEKDAPAGTKAADDDSAPEKEPAAEPETDGGDNPADSSPADNCEEDDGPIIFDPIRDSYACEKNLIKLARGRMVPETVTCMAKLTKLESPVIEHCLLGADLSALMVLSKANGFANGTFTELLKVRDSVNQENGEEKIDIVAMLKRYEAMQTHTAKRIIQFANKKN